MLNSMQVKKRTPFLKTKGCMNMMNKKNLLKMMALGMAAAAVFGLAGCGGGSGASQSASSQTQKESPLMQKIKSSGKLVVGTASGYPPYEFVDTSAGEKKVIGIDMELAQKVADKLGVKLEVQDMNFQALLSSLTGGKVDVAIAGINPTDERKKSMDFSADYLPTEQKVIIRKADADKYKTVEDLYGKLSAYRSPPPRKPWPRKRLKMQNRRSGSCAGGGTGTEAGQGRWPGGRRHCR